MALIYEPPLRRGTYAHLRVGIGGDTGGRNCWVARPDGREDRMYHLIVISGPAGISGLGPYWTMLDARVMRAHLRRTMGACILIQRREA